MSESTLVSLSLHWSPGCEIVLSFLTSGGRRERSLVETVSTRPSPKETRARWGESTSDICTDTTRAWSFWLLMRYHLFKTSPTLVKLIITDSQGRNLTFPNVNILVLPGAQVEDVRPFLPSYLQKVGTIWACSSSEATTYQPATVTLMPGTAPILL